jgi:hypothetical protein
MIDKSSWKPSRTATLILLTLLTLSILSLSCKQPAVVLVPIDPTTKVVQMLPNGNWEVTPAYVINYTLLLVQRAQLILLLKEKGVPIVENIK